MSGAGVFVCCVWTWPLTFISGVPVQFDTTQMKLGEGRGKKFEVTGEKKTRTAEIADSD